MQWARAPRLALTRVHRAKRITPIAPRDRIARNGIGRARARRV